MRIRPEKSKLEIKDGIDKRRSGLDKREGHMKKVVLEKKEVKEVSEKLRLPLKDSIPEIKKSLQHAAKAVVDEFERQNKDLENKHKECEDAEGDLNDRTKMSKDNAGEVHKAQRQINEANNAKPILDQAGKAAMNDAKYTEDQRSRQERDRRRSIKNRDDLKRILQSTQLKL